MTVDNLIALFFFILELFESLPAEAQFNILHRGTGKYGRDRLIHVTIYTCGHVQDVDGSNQTNDNIVYYYLYQAIWRSNKYVYFNIVSPEYPYEGNIITIFALSLFQNGCQRAEIAIP